MSPDEQLLERVRATVAGAAASLNASVARLNDLNVYPVPDGDTGTNLARTVHAVVDVPAARLHRREAAAQQLQNTLPHADCLTSWITTSTDSTFRPVRRCTS